VKSAVNWNTHCYKHTERLSRRFVTTPQDLSKSETSFAALFNSESSNFPPSLCDTIAELKYLPDFDNALGQMKIGKWLNGLESLNRLKQIFDHLPQTDLSIAIQITLNRLIAKCQRSLGKFQNELQCHNFILNILFRSKLTQIQNDTLLWEQTVSSYLLNLSRCSINRSIFENQLAHLQQELYQRQNANAAKPISIFAPIFYYLTKDFDHVKLAYDMAFSGLHDSSSNPQSLLIQQHLLKGDLSIILGNSYRLLKNDETNAQQYFDRSNYEYRMIKSKVYKTVFGAKTIPSIYTAIELRDIEKLNDLLKIIELEYNLFVIGNKTNTHPTLPYTLHQLAVIYMFTGEAILSEGLFRSSINHFEAILNNNSEYQTYDTLLLLINCYADYSYFLTHLLWNNVKRTSEAKFYLSKIFQINQKFKMNIQPTNRQLNFDNNKINGNSQVSDYQLILSPISEPQLPYWLIERMTV